MFSPPAAQVIVPVNSVAGQLTLSRSQLDRRTAWFQRGFFDAPVQPASAAI
jgi:hypothetical protein